MSDAAERLGRPFDLARGPRLKNRFFKSAMSENLGTREHGPSEGLSRLYATWAEGGAGLLVTGNVMIDRRALGEPDNVVIEDERHLEALSAWARAGTAHDTRLWMQINHPGKQSPKNLSPEPVAPSAVPLGKGLGAFFHTPRALEASEIEDLVARFATAAGVARKAGFSGVQIHGAHGYLVSQFLSPHHNRRDDAWGGSLQGRMRFLLEILAAMRAAVGPDFPIGLKLNSADFQKGGFDEEDSIAVVQAVAEAGIDLVEVSGGSYEAPAMTGHKQRESTVKREAYFLEYAAKVRARVDVALVVTGGFRSVAGMSDALASGATDLVGLARPLAVEPDLVARVLAGEDFHSRVRPLRTGISAVDRRAMLEVTWYGQQLRRMADGKPPLPDRGEWASLLQTLWDTGLQGFRRQR